MPPDPKTAPRAVLRAETEALGVASFTVDYETAVAVAENPWKAKLRDLPVAARVLFHSSYVVIGRAGHAERIAPEHERAYAKVLLSVLQARALRRATWALVVATVGLVLLTGVLAYAQIK